MVKKKFGNSFYIRDSGAFGTKKQMDKYATKVKKRGYKIKIVKEGNSYQAYYKVTPKSEKLYKERLVKENKAKIKAKAQADKEKYLFTLKLDGKTYKVKHKNVKGKEYAKDKKAQLKKQGYLVRIRPASKRGFYNIYGVKKK